VITPEEKTESDGRKYVPGMQFFSIFEHSSKFEEGIGRFEARNELSRGMKAGYYAAIVEGPDSLQ
jgi:hypothetical protein